MKKRQKSVFFLLAVGILLVLLSLTPLTAYAEDGDSENYIEEEGESIPGVPYQYFFDEEERRAIAYVHMTEAEQGIVDLSSSIDQALTDEALTFEISSGTSVITLNRKAIDVVKKAMDKGEKPTFCFKKDRGTKNITEEDLKISEWVDPIFPIGYGAKDVRYTVSIAELKFPHGTVLVKTRHLPEKASDLRAFTVTGNGSESAVEMVYKKGDIYFYLTDSAETTCRNIIYRVV